MSLFYKKKKKIFPIKFFYKSSAIIVVRSQIDIFELQTITNYVRIFLKKEWLKTFIQSSKVFVHPYWGFYLNFLGRLFNYNNQKLDEIKLAAAFWIKCNVKALTCVFPHNSRYKFSYERELYKIFITLSAGMLLKLFNISKKATKQKKKVFKLGLLFLKAVIVHQANTFLMLIFRTLHKNIFLYLHMVLEYFDLKKKFYITYFKFKKYNHFIFFKKKRAIKRRLQKRLIKIK